jgi:transcriptional regulator with XRE-family HTH domain
VLKPAAERKPGGAVFAERFKAALDAKKTSQRKAALVLKRSEALVSHWVNGINQPTLDDLATIAGAFGVSADWLLGLTEGATATRPLKPGLDDDALAPADVRFVERQLAIAREALARAEQKTARKK